MYVLFISASWTQQRFQMFVKFKIKAKSSNGPRPRQQEITTSLSCCGRDTDYLLTKYRSWLLRGQFWLAVCKVKCLHKYDVCNGHITKTYGINRCLTIFMIRKYTRIHKVCKPEVSNLLTFDTPGQLNVDLVTAFSRMYEMWFIALIQISSIYLFNNAPNCSLRHNPYDL